VRGAEIFLAGSLEFVVNIRKGGNFSNELLNWSIQVVVYLDCPHDSNCVFFLEKIISTHFGLITMPSLIA
jgi:hypothetical protein